MKQSAFVARKQIDMIAKTKIIRRLSPEVPQVNLQIPDN